MNQLDEANRPEDYSGESFAEFEADLKQALRPLDAPEGFADRVMARVLDEEKPDLRVLTMKPRRRVWIGGAIAAALLGGVFGAELIQTHNRQQQAALVQQQFETGILITDQALAHVRDRLKQAGVGGE